MVAKRLRSSDRAGPKAQLRSTLQSIFCISKSKQSIPLLHNIIFCSLLLLFFEGRSVAAASSPSNSNEFKHLCYSGKRRTTLVKSRADHERRMMYPLYSEDDIMLEIRTRTGSWYNMNASTTCERGRIRRRSQTLQSRPFSFVETFLSKSAARKKMKIDPSTTSLKMVKCRSFDEMLQLHHHMPLLIDFYAPWCGPCKMMKGELSSIRPELEKLGPIRDVSIVNDGVAGGEEGEGGESNNDDQLDKDSANDATTTVTGEMKPTGIPVFHVNTNKFPQVGARNKIHGLPTLVLFFEGQELWRNEGVILGKDVLDMLKGMQEGGCFESSSYDEGTVERDNEGEMIEQRVRKKEKELG